MHLSQPHNPLSQSMRVRLKDHIGKNDLFVSLWVLMRACGGERLPTWHLPQTLSTLFFETGLLPEPAAHCLVGLAGQRGSEILLCLPPWYWDTGAHCTTVPRDV